MYLLLRRYAGAGAKAKNMLPTAKQALVPILQQTAGFKGYCAFSSEDGDLVSITLFEREEQAAKAHQDALVWVNSNLRAFLPEPHEVTGGTVAFHAGPASLDEGAGMPPAPLYVLIRDFEDLRDSGEAERFMRDISLPAIRGARGFRGFYAAWADPARTRAVIVTLFDSRENAGRSNEQIHDIIRRERSATIHPPDRIIAGKAQVVARP